MIQLYYAKVTKLLLMNGLYVIFSTIIFQMWQWKLGLMEILDDFQKADGFAKNLDKHSSHPSIIKIKAHRATARSFVFRDINGSEIGKMIKAMDHKKAHGFDNIPSKLLRLGASGIAHHVSSLINHWLQLCIFPDMFKLAEVSSLYKKKWQFA